MERLSRPVISLEAGKEFCSWGKWDQLDGRSSWSKRLQSKRRRREDQRFVYSKRNSRREEMIPER